MPSELKEKIIETVLLVLASISISIILFIFVFLFKQALPAFQELGLGILSVDFLHGFGLGGAIVGSLLVTAGALSIAFPIGIGSALFLSEIAPTWLRRTLKPLIEVLAGIPSVIYGFIGAMVLVPFLSGTFGMVSGYSLFAGGIIIGVMTLPIVVSVSDDSLKAVPNDIKEGSIALGATPWQTIKHVTLPAASSGVLAATTLGVGKAIGETMAVLMVVSAITTAPDPLFNIFQAGPVLTALIAGHMGEAAGLKVNVLFAAGTFLFVMVACLSIFSDIMRHRVEKRFKRF
ncbi:MAG: phosphate ABC transporter permease subunit PstC [Methermicoccaceae archaeon]